MTDTGIRQFKHILISFFFHKMTKQTKFTSYFMYEIECLAHVNGEIKMSYHSICVGQTN